MWLKRSTYFTVEEKNHQKHLQMCISDVLGQTSGLPYLGRPSLEFHDTYLILKDFVSPLKCNQWFAWKHSLHLPACCAYSEFQVSNYSIAQKMIRIVKPVSVIARAINGYSLPNITNHVSYHVFALSQTTQKALGLKKAHNIALGRYSLKTWGKIGLRRNHQQGESCHNSHTS